MEGFRRIISLLSACLIFLFLCGFGLYETGMFSPAATSSSTTTTTGTPKSPLNNDCRAGFVAFTFDDGPSTYTPTVIDMLTALKMKATFFVIGNRVQQNPAIIREEDARGFTIGDHTYNHRSATGFGPKTTPLTGSQWAAELAAGSAAIVAAGLPKPTLYRAPYDDINNYYNAVAAGLGLRVVMGYGNHATDKIVDSADWSGLSPSAIFGRVVNGYQINGFHMPGIQGGSTVIFHDGEPTAPNVIAALPQIVGYMNDHHLCSTPYPPANDTGGVVPNNPTPIQVSPGSVPPAIGSPTSGG